MNEKMICMILAAALALCVTALIVWAVYFFLQWKRLEEILEEFQRGITEEDEKTREQEMPGRNRSLSAMRRDVQETRESRLISQLKQILKNASGRERKAVDEKNQVMELISDLSHQLKTPLANIVMNMEILEQDTLSEKQRREFLERTGQQAKKMEWLMQTLLKASRLENGIIDFEAKNTGIRKTLARAVGSVYAQAEKKKIRLEAEEVRDFSLYHNPKWTAEAIGNILENAVKYSPEGSTVKITLSRLELYTRITVTDQGIGIPKQEQNRIFQRFYRGRQVDQEEGSGLGLYLAQLILQSEKGYVTVSAAPGGGSSFSVFLLNRG